MWFLRSLKTPRWLEGIWGPATSKAPNRFELQQAAISTGKHDYAAEDTKLNDGIKDRPNHLLVGHDLRLLSEPPGTAYYPAYLTQYYLVPYKERGNDKLITKVYVTDNDPTKDFKAHEDLTKISKNFLDPSDRRDNEESKKWLVWETSPIGDGVVDEGKA